MLVSVSGWSGPSFALRSASVSSWSLIARSCLAGVVIAGGEVVHAPSVSGWSGPSSAAKVARALVNSLIARSG